MLNLGLSNAYPAMQLGHSHSTACNSGTMTVSKRLQMAHSSAKLSSRCAFSCHASTALAMIMPAVLSAAHLDVVDACSCLVFSWAPGSCNPCWIVLSHMAAALQTLKTENGHLWSLIEGHASAEGQWAARLRQDGSSLQALEAERRALRQQVRCRPYSHPHLQAVCSSQRAHRQQVSECPHRYWRLQAGHTLCRAGAGMAVGQSAQLTLCAVF